VFQSFLELLDHSSIALLSVILAAGMAAAFVAAYLIRARQAGRSGTDQQEGYIISAVLGLLALLMGFTFSLATNRFEARRELVIEQSNAIGTAFLRAQLLEEPHRTRLSDLLIGYTDNLIALANAKPRMAPARLAADDRFLTELWAATAAAFDAIRQTPFTFALLNSINSVIDFDASRREARQIHVPTEVFAFLLVYLIVTSGLLGHLLSGWHCRIAASILLVFLAVAFVLVVDIDRPTGGGIRESQLPMEQLLRTMKGQSRAVFDHWRTGIKTH
jgi:hypothetical protein